MAAEKITTISPTTNKPVVERTGPTDEELAQLPKTAQKAFLNFRKTTLPERQKIVKKALQLLTEKQDELAQELTEQMGRPIAYTAKEVTTAVMRGEYLLRISDKALDDTPGDPQDGFKRYVRKTPLGPVLVLFAWNVSAFSSDILLDAADLSTTVSISHPSELAGPSSAGRQQCDPQAVATDTHYRRAHPADLHRGGP